jgi:hypothetical protein
VGGLMRIFVESERENIENFYIPFHHNFCSFSQLKIPALLLVS